MFLLRTTKEQLIEERGNCARLQAELDRVNADLIYLAMMSDVDIDENNEEEE